MSEGMRLDIASDRATITLSRPDKRNAISRDMWTALPAFIREADGSDAPVIVVTGDAGHFAAGADISEFETVYRTTDTASAYTRTMLDGLSELETCAKPTIASISGACVGGGMSIALACDFRLADTTARLGITPSKLGLVYSADDTRRLSNAVGIGAAKRLLMTAQIVDAGEAQEIGLVDQVSEPNSLQDDIDALVAAISGRSQWSVRATKKMFSLVANDDDANAMSLMLEAFDGPDFKEGYRAFLEKRRPTFPTK